ncbi:VOC family protein [Streptomyces sp. NPDC048172]|uniref:VOC family protein n=1 Tax=Streptomyces sp. NPDC048172 TaxID=3365505 RepID=UPI0037209A59
MTDARLGSVNEFCWMDLKTRDLPGTAAFFSEVLGWSFAVDEEDWRRATKISAGGHLIGGVSDLANPVYPPGAAPHFAHYLAVDEVDGHIEAATSKGARLVVPPFDAGDQGRMAMLVDPLGAAFSLWQRYTFGGWNLPPRVPGTPQRMVLASEQPDQARHFYREVLGASLARADFVPARRPVPSTPRWELAVGVEDPEAVAVRARAYGPEAATRTEDVLRVTSPEGLTLQVRPLTP